MAPRVQRGATEKISWWTDAVSVRQAANHEGGQTRGLTLGQLATESGRRRIQPGKPQQNAYVERFNRTARYDGLSQTLFGSIEEVQDAATRWLWTYNNERPNMALRGITPMQQLALVA